MTLDYLVSKFDLEIGSTVADPGVEAVGDGEVKAGLGPGALDEDGLAMLEFEL